MTPEQNLLHRYLMVYWQKLIDGFRLELEKAYPMSRGTTAATIGTLNEQPIEITSSGFRVLVSMPSYYQYLDEGVNGRKSAYSTRFAYTDKMPPIIAIRKFMYDRNITSPKPKKKPIKKPKSERIQRKTTATNTRSGKRRDEDSILNGIAFAIAKSIYNNGLKPSHFYSNVINDPQLLDFENRLLNQFSAYVVSVVRVE